MNKKGPVFMRVVNLGVTIACFLQHFSAAANLEPTLHRMYRRRRQTARTPQCKHCLGNI